MDNFRRPTTQPRHQPAPSSQRRRRLMAGFRQLPRRLRFSLVAVILVVAEVLTMFQPWVTVKSYALGPAGSLLSPVNQQMAAMTKLDANKATFNFNGGIDGTAPAADAGSRAATDRQVAASVPVDASQGVSVLDPTSKVNFKMTPKFGLAAGKQDGNRVVYPLSSGQGWAVYSLHGIGVKEDILLQQAGKARQNFDFELQLNDGQQAKLQADGSVGIYGNKLFSSQITTGTDKDAALLQKARQNAPKTDLLFTIPKPVIIEAGQHHSAATARYDLRGDSLRIVTDHLDTAAYPLSIDPSIYVVTAQQFMAGNNETNIDFNVADKLIQKGRTTGARFDSWSGTTSLPAAVSGAGAAANGGFIYSVGGTTSQGQIFTTAGTSTYTVPAGVTSITAKMWGGGGGGGAGASTAATGGAGGGGGYLVGTISVTPGESLNVAVGGGGSYGSVSTSGSGGGGGGETGIERGTTPLLIAAGGAGGGGGRGASGSNGGDGAAGGGTTGITGTASGVAGGGAGGTQSAGGAGGTGGFCAGQAGDLLDGGNGADGRTTGGCTAGTASGGGTAGAGFLTGGGKGGGLQNNTRSAGGGGGSGYYGGGGGASSTAATGAGGGGGGSSYNVGTATTVTNTAGSGTTAGNSGDAARNNAGNGGTAGAIAGNGTAGTNGILIISYGSGIGASSSVSWAQFNTGTGTIDSANTGNSVCSGWCTTSAYNLPAGRSNFSLIAYNGFLYAIGGETTGGARQSTIYIAKLGANGEPRLWHPTDTNKANWVYWYQDSGLSSVRSLAGAVAYNNRMYVVGGIGASAPVSSVEIANINPTGTLGSWSTATALPVNLYGHGIQIYNDRLYTLGGASTVGGAPLASVYYNKINSDGTLNSWTQTTSFTTARMSGGGTMTSVWGAYMYISGGCSTVNASGYCTAVLADTQVASINTDGSLDIWNTVGGVSSSRIGHNLIAWRSNIYELGGCSAQNASTGDCSTTLSTILYGAINQDGDASTVGQSVASGTAPCSGATPTSCNLPGTANIGNMLNSSVITNGYLYVIGGCTNNTCSTTNANVAYVAINASGGITKPATCPSGAYQGSAWCVDTVHTIAGGLGSASPVVFGGRIYLIGGLDGSGNTNSIYYTSVNTDGSIATWSSQTMSGVGATSVSYFYAYARSNPASASTNPGNLYIFGGCTNSSAAGCTAYSQNVYKCNIQAAGAIAGCSTSGQLQIGTIPGDSATGLGIMSGTVYANYVYLIGGVSPNQQDLTTVRYAKINNSNNVVAASGSSWVQSANVMAVGRRRAAAFGYNGYLYVVGGYEGSSGVLADIEFIKINVSDGSLGTASSGFKVSAVAINQRWGLSVPVSNSFAYVIGGCSAGASPGGCTSRTDVIQTFQIYNNDSGAPAGFAAAANTYATSPNRIGANAAVLNGYIYLAGGCTSTTDCTAATTDVSYAPLTVNGAVGSWTSTTAGLPAGRTWGKLVAAAGTLYYMGGQSSTASDVRSEVYYATPSGGNISSWGTSTNALPAVRTRFGATVWNNRIYVLGGANASGTVANTIYVSPTISGGNIASAWSSSSTAFNVARRSLTAVAYANNLYIMGGYDGTNYLSDTQYAQINSSTGLVSGSWTYTTSLPQPLADSDGFAANGYIYLLGGRSADNVCDPIAMVAPISANTTIASGNNPTGTGEWYITNQRFSGARYGGAAAYYDGKAYILGGACGATLTYPASTSQQTSLLSQPQVAKYSIAMDTDSDTYPSRWLLNGVDNSIGAKWQLRYRSMTNTTTACTNPAMTTWGQETVFGDVTLGTPGIYIPKDANGTTTNCARFYYFNVTVDSSQAFGYPDDVSRGPTITDLTLQFTADPSKRLMHGRTFTGGLQMPDDTPLYSN